MIESPTLKYDKSVEPRCYKGKSRYMYVPSKRIECECGKSIHEGMWERHVLSKPHIALVNKQREFEQLRENIRQEILDSFGIQNGLVPQNIIGVDVEKPLETLIEG